LVDSLVEEAQWSAIFQCSKFQVASFKFEIYDPYKFVRETLVQEEHIWVQEVFAKLQEEVVLV
jgi:hypothetical protein